MSGRTETPIEERFDLIDKRARGGMGTIYKAKDRVTGEIVALKVLTEGTGNLERFTHEAAVLQDLQHDAIVRYVAHGLSPDGWYLAMEWLDGEDLGQRLEREPLTPADTVTLVTRIAEALGVAHARGVIHRDLKPSNIFLPGGDPTHAKLLDFGVARSELDGRAETRTGSAIGTPGYMAPEQARGDRDLDARVDVFGLGAVLYRCLTGQAPFDAGNTIGSLARVLFEETPRLAAARPELPASLDEVVAQALAKDRAKRYADGRAFAAALRAVAPELATASPPSIGTSGITGGEDRIVSSVLARRESWSAPVERGLDSPTHTEPTVAVTDDADAAAIRKLAVALRGSFEKISDGTWAIVFTASGSATEMAVRAARLSRQLVEAMPDVKVVVTTGRSGGGPTTDTSGDAFARAGALLTRAEHGMILVDDVTASLLDGRMRLDRSGNEAILRHTEETGTRHSRPLIGRGKELRLLRNLIDDAFTEGQPGAAVVVAAAGMGKTRLGAEVMEQARRDGVTVWRGAGDPLAASSPFALLDAVVRAAAADGELPPAALTQQDPSIDPIVRGDQLRRAVEDWAAAIAARARLLIVLDDVQWADPPTILLFDGLLRNVRAPVFVLALARPEIHERFANLWSERGAVSAPLGPLPPMAAEQMARAALGADASDATVQALIERSGGNPFFLEELAKVRVASDAGEWPRTVLAVAEARLAALDGDARRVLRAASVIGPVFWDGAVIHLLGGGAFSGVVSSRMAAMIERELVIAAPASRFEGEKQLQFKNALVRDAAYGTLTEDDRKLAHTLAAAWLEKRGEADAVIAEHYELAGERARAIAPWSRAAEAAVVGNDLAGAVQMIERAIAGGARGFDRGLLRSLEAEASWWRGDHARAEEAGEEALQLLGDGTPRWYAALGAAASAAGARGDTGMLVALAEALLRAPAERDRSNDVVASVKLVNSLTAADERDRAQKLIARIKAQQPHLADEDPAWGWIEHMRFLLAMRDGELGRAITAVRDSVAAYEAAADLRSAGLLRMHHGTCLTLIGQLEAAEAALRQSVAESARVGAAYTAAHGQLHLGHCLALLGRSDEAEAQLRACRDELRAGGDSQAEARALGYLALAIAGERQAEAEHLLADAIDLVEAHPPLRAALAAGRARLLLRRDAVDDALALAGPAHDRIEAGAIILEGEAMIRLAWAECLAAAGRRDAAAAVAFVAAQRLRTRARRLGDPAWAASFLERIPENAATLALAAKLEG